MMATKIHALRKGSQNDIPEAEEPLDVLEWFLPILTIAFLSMSFAAALYEYRTAMIVMELVAILACGSMLVCLFLSSKEK